MVSVNEDTVKVVRWLCPPGSKIEKGTPLCVVETSKSDIEVESEAAGYLTQLASVGEEKKVGSVLGFVGTTPEESIDLTPSTPAAVAEDNESVRWTKKAEMQARQLKVDIKALASSLGRTVQEKDVLAAAASTVPVPAPLTGARPSAQLANSQERVLVLGGGGGAALVIDIIARTPGQRVVGILDNEPRLHGTELMNVPILGDFDKAEELWKKGTFDRLISTVVRDVKDRKQIFLRFQALGIPFTNVIDPSVSLRLGVQLGTGNLIIHGGYFATGVTIGDNNFFAAGTFIEHHSTVGSHTTMGPRCTLSGKVEVGDEVKMGMCVGVEPWVKIGDRAIIASGQQLTANVSSDQRVKSLQHRSSST
jgi:sugar O-acyltransferase (sialic acid O-acetyltransferase NeuD family)